MGACCSSIPENSSQQPVQVIIKISGPPTTNNKQMSNRSNNKKFQNIDFSDDDDDEKIKLINEQDKINGLKMKKKQQLGQNKLIHSQKADEQIKSKNQEIDQQNYNDNSLWKLNHQLSTMVCTFENNFGSISYMTDQSNEISKEKNKKSYRIEKKKNTKKDTVFACQGNGEDKGNLKKKKRKDTHVDEKNNNALQKIKFRKITQNDSEQNIQFNLSSIQQSLHNKISKSLKKNQNKRFNRLQSDKVLENLINKNVPIEKKELIQGKQGNCKSDIDIQSNMQSQTQDNQEATSTKSLKINKEKLLDSSLATERVQQKNVFYDYRSQVNGHTLQKWEDLHSKGIDLNIKKFLKNFSFDQLNNQKNEDDKLNFNQVDQFTMSVLGAIETYNLHHGIKLISYKQVSSEAYEFRIFVNGTKRSIKKLRKSQQQPKQQLLIGIIKLFEEQYNKNQHYQLPCFAINYLTGWIPECIQLQDIPLLANMLDRIHSNFSQGQTIITFSKTDKFQPKQSNKKIKSLLEMSKYFYLVEMDSDSRLLKIATLKTLLRKSTSEHFRKSIKFDTKKRKSINNVVSEKKLDENGQILVSWDTIVQNFDVLNVNWNPSIYDFSYNLQGIIFQKNLLSSKNKKVTNLRNNFPQYLLRIPPNKEDLELRLLLQIHLKQSCSSLPKIWFQLYDFHEFRVYNSAEAIRKTISEKKVSRTDMISDVFVFESAQEWTQYSLVIVAENLINTQEQDFLLYTLSLFSFFEVGVKPLRNQFANKLPDSIIKSPLSQCSFLYHEFGLRCNGKQSMITQEQIETNIEQTNYGHSINSPFFAHNLHFALQIPPLTKIQIVFEAFEKQEKNISSFTFDINIIADPLNKKDIAKIPLDVLLNENYRSCICQGIGGCEFISKYQNYIIVIAGFSGQNMQEQKQCRLHIRCLSQLDSQSGVSKNQKNYQTKQIKVQEIFFRPTIIFEESFSWLPNHFGPRKRHKSNSSPSYYPISTFQDFFNNPIIEHYLQAGKYQFNVSSLTYKDQFVCHPHYLPDQNQYNPQQDKSIISLSQMQAPTLSLSVMRMSGDMKSCKIILDDAYYVPFGMGFWSGELILQEGIYRFICPKIQQEISEQGSEGILSIRKITT